MKVFVDTNVWLAGRFRSGLCADLLEALVSTEIEILVDVHVIEEFRRVAVDKLKVEAELLARATDFFHRYTTVVPAAADPAADISDPDDAPIVAAALQASATWFLTGDKALLAVGGINGMRFLDPRSAYERLHGLR